jgi:hypothetical protein
VVALGRLFDDTVTPDNHFRVIPQEFLLFLQGMCHQFWRPFFQQEGTRQHTANVMLDVHSEQSDNSTLFSAMV